MARVFFVFALFVALGTLSQAEKDALGEGMY